MAIRRAMHVASADWTPRQLAAAVTGYHRRDVVARLETAAGAHLGLEVVAFGSARAALAALLIVAPPASRTVVVPAYTCIAVPNALATADCAVRWIDVVGPNLDLVEAASAARPGDAVLAQHTYGIEIPSTGLEDLRSRGVLVIEDRAHRFDGDGIGGDAALFSMEHSKVVSAGLGGLIWARDPGVMAALRSFRGKLKPVSWGVARRVLMTSAAQVGFDARWIPRGPSSFLRRAAFRFPPTSYPAQSIDELAGAGVRILAMHPDLAEVGVRGITHIEANLEHRRTVGAIYRERLGGLLPDWARGDRALVRQPIVLDDAEAVRLRLRRAAIDLGPRWFEAPIHPEGSSSTYVPGTAPRAERLAASVLSLPTHMRLDALTARRIADAIVAGL